MCLATINLLLCLKQFSKSYVWTFGKGESRSCWTFLRPSPLPLSKEKSKFIKYCVIIKKIIYSSLLEIIASHFSNWLPLQHFECPELYIKHIDEDSVPHSWQKNVKIVKLFGCHIFSGLQPTSTALDCPSDDPKKKKKNKSHLQEVVILLLFLILILLFECCYLKRRWRYLNIYFY